MTGNILDNYATASSLGLAEALAARRISAVELFDTAVAAIEARDGAINAVVMRDFDRARESAKAADAALARGERRPLLGVPMTIKESHHIAGLPTTWGLEPFKDWTPTWDSTGVARLKAAGAVILGKTNVPTSLADWQTINPIYGRTNNPLDLARTPGGSSGGGAAALAAGMVPLEFGSDIGGSIRVPAHFCGLYGHKPSFNLIPQTGHAPPGFAEPGVGVELAVVGPLARSAGDLELALNVLAGPAGDMAKGYRLMLPAPRARQVSDLRVLVIDHHPIAGADAEVLGVLNNLADSMVRGGAKVIRAATLDSLPDFGQTHEAYMGMSGAIISRMEPGFAEPITAHAWMDLIWAQDAVRRQWAKVFETVDVVLAPPFGVAAFPHIDEPDWGKRSLMLDGEPTPYGVQLAWSGIASFANLPATCAPVGTTAGGLPVGVQIIGPFLEDRTTIAVAEMVGQLTGR
ncbi:MAG TPA: amidase family protein [Rhodopila sp.]